MVNGSQKGKNKSDGTKEMSIYGANWNWLLRRSQIYLQLADSIFSDNLAPTNKHECVQQLCQARREVTEIVNKSYAQREEEYKA